MDLAATKNLVSLSSSGLNGAVVIEQPVAAGTWGDFEPWYRAEHPKLLAALTWVSGNPDLAADATDEAFARVLARWRRVQHMSSPGGYLYRVGLNVVRRTTRRLALERKAVTANWRPEMLPAPAGEIWQVVRDLPSRQRVAVVLRYLLDLPEKEVAQVMGVSSGTVASTLSAARTRLADWLRTEETEVSHE